MRFVKLQGLGNDFVLVDRLGGGGPVTPEEGRALCDRRLGVGADGVLTVLPSRLGVARMHVTNADGSVAQMCGNGIRCVAKYLADDLAMRGDELLVESDAGLRACRLHRDPSSGQVVEVTVDMGAPELEAAKVPVHAEPGRFVQQPIGLEGYRLRGTAVSMGNPHLVLFGVPHDVAASLGPRLEHHPMFPERVNVEFALAEAGGLSVVVWERGVGLTQACGTGACAAAVAAVLECRARAGEEIPVRLPGGTLHVRVAEDLSRVFMRGPAQRVFSGEF